ncbi:MAG TPA: LLM class flavin-dependent oxidoreductase [Ilumatobacter sp.]|nr:LLM class flavin-dependent oxidoreductase [Ilumatobacter sp.]
MRSTGSRPAPFGGLYDDAVSAAIDAEACGFDSIWLAEHRFWYDGWCPQPIHVAAAMLAATTSLHVGTAMYLLPQHAPASAATTAQTCSDLSGGRLELGVSLGYRAEEYSGLGLDIRRRVGLMESALDHLDRRVPELPLWMGGMAPAAVVRAARRGIGLMLPPTLPRRKVGELIEQARRAAADAGRQPPPVGMLKDVWIGDDDTDARSFFVPRLRRHYAEYATAWWARGDDDQPDPAKVDAQIERSVEAAFVGSAATVAEQLGELAADGVSLFVLQFHSEQTDASARQQMQRIGRELLPLVRSYAGGPR